MRKVLPIIQELIHVLRATRMPWIGDEIEVHIRMGRVNLFQRGEDDKNELLHARQVSLLGQKDQMEVIAEAYRDDSIMDEDAEDLNDEEQIDAALKIIDANITGRVKLIDASYTCLLDTFGLVDVKLAVLDGEGEIIPLLSNEAREAADELPKLMKELEKWLIQQKSFRIGE